MNHLTLKCINVNPLEGNDVAPPLTLESEYHPVHVHQCPEPCNQVHFDVGLISKHNFVRCHNCQKVLPNSQIGGQHWCHPTRFEKI